MANNLTAAQRTAFRALKGVFPPMVLVNTGTLSDGVTTRDVGPDITDWGVGDLALFGTAPGNQGTFDYPILEWILRFDAVYARGKVGSLWPDDDLTGWEMRLVVTETVSNPAGVVLADITVNLQDVRLEGDRVRIIGAHKLGTYWAKEWTKDDRHEVDYNGKDRTVFP